MDEPGKRVSWEVFILPGLMAAVSVWVVYVKPGDYRAWGLLAFSIVVLWLLSKPTPEKLPEPENRPVPTPEVQPRTHTPGVGKGIGILVLWAGTGLLAIGGTILICKAVGGWLGVSPLMVFIVWWVMSQRNRG